MILTVLVCAHNEEDVIADCLKSLRSIDIPRGITPEYYVVLDRCTDRTKDIAEEMGFLTLEKNSRGNYLSPNAEAIAFGINNTQGDIILVCDADVQEIPKYAFVRLLQHLTDVVKRVSSEVVTRSGKWWLDFVFWFLSYNRKITPLGTEPRGAFTVFYRKTVEQIGGFDQNKPTWDTAFDIKLKNKGWNSKRIKSVIVIEKRPFTLKRLMDRQITDGNARRQLKLTLSRVLMHSIFRFRPFVLFGYIQQTWREKFG